jgi:predicted enzyme related to lactoylglutathione lyase
VEVEPVDLPGVARIAVIRDPGGAQVTLWQAKGFMGASLVNEVGAWGWDELATPAMEEAKAFYGDLFGWKAEDMPGPIARAAFTLGDLLIGGIHAPSPFEENAPVWTVSFGVADADDSSSKAEELGGRIVLPPMDIPIGRFAFLADPFGATFTIAAVPGGAFRGVDGS